MGSDPRGEERAPLVADPDNRAIVTAARDAGGPLHVEELADRLARHDATLIEVAEYEDEVDRTKLALHHNHLPRLAIGRRLRVIG